MIRVFYKQSVAYILLFFPVSIYCRLIPNQFERRHSFSYLVLPLSLYANFIQLAVMCIMSVFLNTTLNQSKRYCCCSTSYLEVGRHRLRSTGLNIGTSPLVGRFKGKPWGSCACARSDVTLVVRSDVRSWLIPNNFELEEILLAGFTL